MSTLISVRKPHLDILRVLCIFFVVYMHTYIATPPVHTATGYYLYLFANMCIRVTIPIFFMITGAVLLHKEEPIHPKVTKRIFSFGVIIIATISLQIVIGSWLKAPTDFMLTLKNASGHYLNHIGLPIGMNAQWYLYAHLAILIMLPIMRPAAQNMNNRTFLALRQKSRGMTDRGTPTTKSCGNMWLE